jgi:hypothetical protein
VYIGQSDWPSRRVWSHVQGGKKDFDYEVYLPVPDPADLLESEKHWIRTVCPCHNKSHNPSPDPDAAGWGADPGSFFVRLPARYRELLRLITEKTHRTMTVDAQIALELRARSMGIDVADFVTKPRTDGVAPAD